MVEGGKLTKFNLDAIAGLYQRVECLLLYCNTEDDVFFGRVTRDRRQMWSPGNNCCCKVKAFTSIPKENMELVCQNSITYKNNTDVLLLNEGG